jgi:hypothetical protein
MAWMALNRAVSIAEVDLLVGLRTEPAQEALADGPVDAIFRGGGRVRTPEAQHAFALIANNNAVAFFMLRELPTFPTGRLAAT